MQTGNFLKIASRNFPLQQIYGEKLFMHDNACYFLSFDDFNRAYYYNTYFNSDMVNKFLKNIAFKDSKRPYSKRVLKRIDIKKCLKILSFNDLKTTEEKLGLENYINENKFKSYKLNF